MRRRSRRRTVGASVQLRRASRIGSACPRPGKQVNEPWSSFRAVRVSATGRSDHLGAGAVSDRRCNGVHRACRRVRSSLLRHRRALARQAPRPATPIGRQSAANPRHKRISTPLLRHAGLKPPVHALSRPAESRMATHAPQITPHETCGAMPFPRSAVPNWQIRSRQLKPAPGSRPRLEVRRRKGWSMGWVCSQEKKQDVTPL